MSSLNIDKKNHLMANSLQSNEVSTSIEENQASSTQNDQHSMEVISIDDSNEEPSTKIIVIDDDVIDEVITINEINPLENYQPLIDTLISCSECNQVIQDKSMLLFWECLNFCDEDCLAKYQKNIGKLCVNCNKTVSLASLGRYCVRFGSDIRQFCGNKCLNEFKKSTKICCHCQAFITGQETIETTTMINDNNLKKEFCTQMCMNKYYELNNPKNSTNIGLCNVCNIQKLIRIEIIINNKINNLCSEPCFVAFKFAKNIVTEQCTMCHKYYEHNTLEHTLCLNDSQILHFCGKICQNIYIIMNRKIIACDWCKVKKYNFDMIEKNSLGINKKIIVCSFNCLALYKSNSAQVQVSNTQLAQAPVYNTRSRLAANVTKSQSTSPIRMEETIKYVQQLIVMRPPVCEIKNKSTMCKPNMQTKGVSFKPLVNHKGTQCDKEEKSVIIPVPVPIYVPMPAVCVSAPFPIPVPFPLPVPVPIFIPTTRNSAEDILKEIKHIQVRLPSDPYEAELLMMAEMVAGTSSLPIIDNDVLEMELNVTENDSVKENAHEIIDLEGALASNTIPVNQETEASPSCLTVKSRGKRLKKSKKDLIEIPLPNNPPQVCHTNNDFDTNMSLKYSFGVNAWKQWIQMKQNDLDKQYLSGRYGPNKIKTDLLQLSSDELNFSLSTFINEIRKPNNTQYAPDTIYYLCLGIQYYLYKNNRCDNIFTDIYYEKFTECLNSIAKMFSILYNDSHYIITRVEEEHLWECQQLGAHSPQVLLNTLIFFNTKYFNLITVEDHMQISFSHIMKHWKRNHSNIIKNKENNSLVARNVLLRYYPPNKSVKERKVYEQEENEENPIRCPVRLYEFYLSKCPESVKTRNDVFYLSPERSCLPDSPVWYSTLALDSHTLEKMLYRVKMVKEINVAILRT